MINEFPWSVDMSRRVLPTLAISHFGGDGLVSLNRRDLRPQSPGSFGRMVRISVLHDALKTMYNAEKRGKRQVLIRPSSKVVIKFLQVMMRHGELRNTREQQDQLHCSHPATRQLMLFMDTSTVSEQQTVAVQPAQDLAQPATSSMHNIL